MPALGNANGKRGQVRFLRPATGDSFFRQVPGSGKRCERGDGLPIERLVISIKGTQK